MHKYYKCFAILRIILTCIPQSGYIHPDEYFQSIEVISEKVLEVQVNKPWEFKASFPVRSISSMYLTVGSSLYVLKALNYFLGHFFGITLITPYFVLIFARLAMCLLSFLVDWSLYKICRVNYEKYESRLLILSISYVMIIYGTRTFSNTLELVLFALLLYYVCESLIFSTTNIKKYQYLDHRYRAAIGPVEKAKFRKLQLFLEGDTFRNWFVISTITVIGIFNRPTFIAYAVGPIFYWLYRGMGTRVVPTLSFHIRALVFQLGVIPTVLVYIVIDSFYFGYLTWGEIGVLKVSLDNFVVTPWNFIKYNLDTSNLAKHGLHPRYLHAAINVPLLFNILTLYCYSTIWEVMKCILHAKYHYLPTMRSIKGLMMMSFFVPLLLLSCIPHQEPRFLIPLIVPLVYMFGAKILPETDTVVVRAPKSDKSWSKRTSDVPKYWLCRAWIVINILLALFYGFLHQGGIYSFIAHINSEMKTNQYEYHIITSNVYSIPESLFLQKNKNYDSFQQNYTSAKRVIVHELGSKSLNELLIFIVSTLKYCEGKSRPNCKVHLVMPNTLMKQVKFLHYNRFHNLVKKNTSYFYPHMSTEKPPILPCFNIGQCLHLAYSGFKNYYELFSLVSIEYALECRESADKL